MNKVCARCRNELDRKIKLLGKPFYKQDRAVCSNCYKEAQEKIKIKIEYL